jgi:hypothetical protein
LQERESTQLLFPLEFFLVFLVFFIERMLSPIHPFFSIWEEISDRTKNPFRDLRDKIKRSKTNDYNNPTGLSKRNRFTTSFLCQMEEPESRQRGSEE